MKKYDAIVIGAGQAGGPLSKYLANQGLHTALIEQRWVGGTCVNDGCSPTKAMIASARTAYLANTGKDLGIIVPKLKVDMEQIVRRQKKIVETMRTNVEKGIIKTKNLDLIYGSASFSGTKQITIQLNTGKETVVSADRIYINTGARPSIPEISGLENIDYLTSTTILNLKEVPKHLLVIGTGYVGLEFGQMFSRFGSKVTLVEGEDRILHKEDEDVVDEIGKILKDEGIDLMTSCKVKAFYKRRGKIAAMVHIKGKVRMITCSHVLIATGRKPNTDELNLTAAGIDMNEKGYVNVDEFLETSADGVYALGDVNGGPPFTHIAFDDYRIASHNLDKSPKLSTVDRVVPYCMFIDPQLGRVGLTETQAKEKGLKIKVACMPSTAVARSIETGDTRGLMKAVVDADSGQILGAAILSTEGGEVVSVLQMAMKGKIKWQEIHDMAIAHPTFSESLNNLFAFEE